MAFDLPLYLLIPKAIGSDKFSAGAFDHYPMFTILIHCKWFHKIQIMKPYLKCNLHYELVPHLSHTKYLKHSKE